MLTSEPSTMNPSPASLQNLSAKIAVTRESKLAEKLKLGGYRQIGNQIPILKELESVYFHRQPMKYQDQFAEPIVGCSKEELFDINEHKFSTVTKALHYKNEEQYRSLETFHEHLIANCFPSVKLTMIKGSKCTSLVNYPAPAIIHFYYNVSPAYIIVQDLAQCDASNAMMIINTLEDIMSKFDLVLKIVSRRSISKKKKKKKSKRAPEKSQKSNRSVLWETKTHLMLPGNDAASTISKVKDSRLYRTLVTYFKSSEQGTSSSRDHDIRPMDTTYEVTLEQGASSSGEHVARPLDRTSSRNHDILSLDKIHEVTSDHGTSAKNDTLSLDRMQEVKADQGISSSAENDIPSLDRIHEVTSDHGTSSSAENDIPSLDSIHEVTSDHGTSPSAENIPSLDRIHEVTSDHGTSPSAKNDVPSLDRIHEVTSGQGTLSSTENDIPSLVRIHEVTSDHGTLPSVENDIPSLDRIHEVTPDHGTSSSAENDILSLDKAHEVTSDQGTSSSAEYDIPSVDRIHDVTSDQGTSSSAEHDIRSLPERRKRETKSPFTAKTTKQVEEMECEIIQLHNKVRSLVDKFDESKGKLRAKEAIGVKSTETQTSKEQEEVIVWRLQDELRKSKEKTVKAEKSFKSMEAYYKKLLLDVNKKNADLNEKTDALERKLQNMEEYMNVTLADLGRALVERDTLIKEMKARGTAHSSPVKVTSSSSQTSEMSSLPEPPTRSRGAEAITEPDEHLTVNCESGEENSRSNTAAYAVQEEANGGDRISLANIPTTTVEKGLYYNYKLLVLLITRMLLSGDVIKFKEWAGSIFPVGVTASVDDIFLELDRRRVISVADLEKLREFFEKILRIDLVHMVDCFMMGDYTYLRHTSDGTSRRNNQGNTSGVVDASQRAMTNSRTSLQSSAPPSGEHRQSSLHSQLRTREVEESYVLPQSMRPDTSVGPSNPRTEGTEGTTHQPMRGQLVTDTQGSRNATNVSTANRPRLQGDMGSNARTLSTFQRPDSARNHNSNAQAPDDDSDSDDESQWLCSHYKRRCHVKFDCCDKYWPCHRCHNKESKCGQKKLKSRDTKFVKCLSCGREQQFSSQAQFCTNCHKKFAKYFCAICKHLTGTEDNPYHCEKCGICRIHRDRSFHCDVCGVCLDVQLRGRHKCRAGSAHDECCICLEDAFTGCQILPCSHKVHKECATQMIRSGITRCPICRESFADKLERRNLPPPKKPPGK